jgi:hypothetical protein
MAEFDMRDFVADDGGEFVICAAKPNHASIQADLSSGQGEGVQGRIVEDGDFPAGSVFALGSQYAIGDALSFCAEGRIACFGGLVPVFCPAVGSQFLHLGFGDQK